MLSLDKPVPDKQCILSEVHMESLGIWWMWAGFAGIILLLLLVDLIFVGGGKQHKVSLKEAAVWSVVWVSVALLFNFPIFSPYLLYSKQLDLFL
jgi:hypothetical protein